MKEKNQKEAYVEITGPRRDPFSLWDAWKDEADCDTIKKNEKERIFSYVYLVKRQK